MKPTKENIIRYLKELQSELQSKGIVQLALFGSYAKGEQNIYSDIDIAIKKDRDYFSSVSPYYYFELVNAIKDKIRTKFHKNTDIFDLDATSSFKQTIEKELIYV
ncbi:MAG: nucleotidyltransferase family protein [Campylobacterota bacterium]